MAQPLPACCSLLVGNLPESQEPHGRNQLRRKWWMDALCDV